MELCRYPKRGNIRRVLDVPEITSIVQAVLLGM